MWNYVVTAQKPTSVTHSVTGNFTGPDDLNLIVAKSTRLEIFMLTPEGQQPLLDVGLYGRIAAMELFRPAGDYQDLLFICTERYKFCVLAYDAATGEIVTRANGDAKDHIGRPSDNGMIAIVDPKCRMIGMQLYDGLFKVIPIDSSGQLKEAFNIRLEELCVLDVKFLDGCAKPTIAVLWQDTKFSRHVKTYEINVNDKDFDEGPWAQSNVEMGASKLVSVPAPFGGCLYIGEQGITYQKSNSYNKSIRMKPTMICTAAKVDADGSRYLLGDQDGTLYVLILQNDEKNVVDLKLEALGETSISSTLSYLDNGVVFVGSAYGDSQLIKLNAKKGDNDSYIEVLESFINLGPIVDFCVVDLERQGQGQVVTCSGAFKDGSVRIVRNGIGIFEQATVELPGIKGMWSLRPSYATEYDKFLVQAFVGETRILGIGGEELEETEIEGFNSMAQTIYCANVLSDHFVQVTESSARLIVASSCKLVDEWKPADGARITVVAGSPTQLALSTGGGSLTYIEIEDGKLNVKNTIKVEHEVACIDITPVGEDSTKSPVIAVGMWTDISVRILKVPSLDTVLTEKLGGEIIPRSLLFSTFEGVTYLLCALGDGHLFNFVYDVDTMKLSERKKVSLGTQPISLKTFRSKATSHVFAASDRPAVIYSSNHKLLYSNVNLKEVNHICPFNSENFPESLAIASESMLTIGTIDDIQKLHIRTVPIGETVRRICHQESTRTFAVATMKVYTDEQTNEEVETSSVRLFDDQTFEALTVVELEKWEIVGAVISTQFKDDPNTYYIVGTGYAVPTEPEPTRGRIIVYQVRNTRLELVSEKEVKGAVYSLDGFNGKLLAGINSKVQLFGWNEQEDHNRELQAEFGHHGHILALYVKSRGDFIVVGDLMKSVSLLLYKSIDGSIDEIARDFNANWMTAVHILDDDTYMGAENSFNLFTLRRNADATSDEERCKLEVAGEFHLGEYINTFRSGSLVMKTTDGNADSAPVPTMLFGTVNGVIGVVAQLAESQYNMLLKVQNALTKVIKGVGGFSHEEWRSFSNERRTSESKNFLDGDLIESFLDLKRPKMEEVLKLSGLDMSVEELSRRVEELSRLH